MAESYVQVTEGSGKKLHTYQRSIGGTNVEDEVVLLGDSYLATHTLRISSVALVTAASHLCQLMAGSTNKLHVRKVLLVQEGIANAAGRAGIQIVRLTTAGTGGGAAGFGEHDPGDGNTNATGMTLPTSKGTEGDIIVSRPIGLITTQPTTGNTWLWEQTLRGKPIIVNAGTSNGIAIKNVDADSAADVAIELVFDEVGF